MFEPFLLVAIAGHKNDLHGALSHVNICVEVLEGLEHVLAWGTPFGREEKSDVFEATEVLHCGSFGQAGLFTLTLSRPTLLDK